MTDHELELQLRDWFRTDIPDYETEPAALRASVLTVPRRAAERRRWFQQLRGLKLFAVAALLAAAIIGSAVVGGRLLVTRPAPSPVMSPVPSAQPSTQSNTAKLVYTRRVRLANGEGGCVAAQQFGFCHRSSVFVSEQDGSEAHELFPDYAFLLTGSREGTLIVATRGETNWALHLTDITASTSEPLDTGCRAPCHEDWSFALSPDGRRLAFVRFLEDETSLLAVMDMASGTVDELESTLGLAGPPGWSPDSSRLAFANHVIDADGGNLRQIAPADLFTDLNGGFAPGYASAQWSPDGSLIVLTSFSDTVTRDPPDNSQALMDIYVVPLDGTDLRRLTTDTVAPLGTTDAGEFGASFPSWTKDGRIVFIRYPLPPETEFELWVMDADGQNETQLDPSDAGALTALGCTNCAYPAIAPTDAMPPFYAYWVEVR